MNETNGLAAASPSDIAAAAERLAGAAASGVPCSPVRDLIGRDDLAAAYAVQAALAASRLAAGARITGRKIGLTSEAVQRQLGVDQPDLGVLFEDMAYADGDTIPIGRVLQPRAEAEIAFVLRADLDAGPLDAPQVRAAIAYAVAALEICGSRIAGWDISFGDTVADNASSGAYVLGTERRTLDEFDPVDVAMSMSIGGEEVSTGTGAACLGDPIEAVVWLARMARDLGEPLRAGQVVLSGALGPMRPVAAGDTVTATLSGLGTVTVRFTEGAAA
ncbi:2-keto-4-pentenoate hydratase [Nonomuraea rhodomycinica]|uniref:Fumarylacetoacetate hydrolase family protein n=1 Tax=Nonomuraea rhodomycinica TaxID=1712872 RepID=A0A7Y6MH02_9ACTN|nr:fumarylacetoacetate hydrolase family protein [Nonomuraea rhodomycinica]NUW46625.1 fumarylacetoacetate hydrolase family protein [Nonomuraea rhodomycinica]